MFDDAELDALKRIDWAVENVYFFILDKFPSLQRRDKMAYDFVRWSLEQGRTQYADIRVWTVDNREALSAWALDYLIEQGWQ